MVPRFRGLYVRTVRSINASDLILYRHYFLNLPHATLKAMLSGFDKPHTPKEALDAPWAAQRRAERLRMPVALKDPINRTFNPVFALPGAATAGPKNRQNVTRHSYKYWNVATWIISIIHVSPPFTRTCRRYAKYYISYCVLDFSGIDGVEHKITLM